MMVERESTVLIVGKKKVGKSSVAKAIAMAHVKAGAATFVQDEFGQFKDILPWYESPAHYHAAQRARQERGEPQELSAAIGGADAEALSAYVLALAARLEKHPDSRIKYVAIIYDEAVNIVGMSPSHIPPQMESLLAKSRHLNIALTILCQDPIGQLHKRWRALQTDVLCFRTSVEDRIKAMAGEFGFNKDLLAQQISLLPDRWGFLWLKDEAFVST